MKKIAVALAVALPTVLVQWAKSDVLIDGFESGNYAGWTFSAEYGSSDARSGGDGTWQYYDGSTNVPTPKLYPFDPLTNPYITERIGFVSNGTAPEGASYLALGGIGHSQTRPLTAPNGDPYFFLDRDYTVVLSREFSIAAGQALSLWVKFDTEEELPAFDFDDLQVRIDGVTVFRLSPHALDPRSGFPPFSSGWRQISWTPPASGNYTLSLASFADDQAASSASFDGIMIVPEPATGAMGILGFLLLGRSRMVRRIL